MRLTVNGLDLSDFDKGWELDLAPCDTDQHVWCVQD
jgi:hypothetical protein